ncbi:hypothetical protein, conserved [Eimeria brunetti]|uniref:Uncharacterized protein n=1 Tax=Eimeria brunetti TaxID=51314 RepID=U6LI33_9EIME|nr:hypothetical protein, conserved [Eimeria brunetti]
MGDEEEQSDIVEQCLDLEEALGLGVGGSKRDEEASDAKARLAEMLYDSAAIFERKRVFAAQRLQDDPILSAPKIPRLDVPWPSTPHPQESIGAFWQSPSGAAIGYEAGAVDADAWAREDSELVFDGNEEQRRFAKLDRLPGLQPELSEFMSRSSALYRAEDYAKAPASLSAGRARSNEDAGSPDAWLDDNMAETHPQPFQQRVLEIAPPDPAVGAALTAYTDAGSVATFNKLSDSGIDGSIPPTDVGRKSGVQPIQKKAVQQLDEKSADSFTVSAIEGSAPAAAAEAASSGGGKPCGAENIRLHPFVHLPVVNPRDIPRSFRPQFALSHDLRIMSPMESYTTMRKLFAKASLTSRDAESLIREAELLSNYARIKLGRPYKRVTASYLFKKLSSVFMVFDHLVCTIEVLGDKMDTNSWWAEFVQQFRTDFLFPDEAGKEKTKALNKVVNRLSSALSVYKTGKRPELKEIIELKRIILSMPYKRSQSSHRLWKLWIQDDKKFSSSAGEFGSLSDGGAQSQRKKTAL